MKISFSRLSRLSNDLLMSVLTVAVVSSLILIAIGSFNTYKISKGFQYGVTTDFRLQQLSGNISHYDEILTMSARMAAATGNLSWQARYNAYEPLLVTAIEQAVELAPDAYSLYAEKIDEANLSLIRMENEAFDLVKNNNPDRALSVLFSDAYEANKEQYGSELRKWSEELNGQIVSNLNRYGRRLTRSSLYSLVSFWILTTAWIVLLMVMNQYIHRRRVAEKRLRQAKYQIEINHRALQLSEADLQQKAATLEQALKDLQQAQVQMVHSEKMSGLGQMVAGVAHEINNPVNFIHANLEPISEYASSLLKLVECYQSQYPQPTLAIESEIEAADLDFVKADLPKVLNSMRVGTERIRQIVLSLRNFSRSDEQGLKAVDIHEGLESTLLILQHRLKDKSDRTGIVIERDYGDLPEVECYPGQLNQVFMNLLANSLDALEAVKPDEADRPNKITLRTDTFTRGGVEWVEIAIADTGPGISLSAQARIFDAFYTTKPVGKGTGMGLSISHTIVTKNHGGSLSCTSSGTGAGSEFIIQIPMIAATIQAPTSPPHSVALV